MNEKKKIPSTLVQWFLTFYTKVNWKNVEKEYGKEICEKYKKINGG